MSSDKDSRQIKGCCTTELLFSCKVALDATVWIIFQSINGILLLVLVIFPLYEFHIACFSYHQYLTFPSRTFYVRLTKKVVRFRWCNAIFWSLLRCFLNISNRLSARVSQIIPLITFLNLCYLLSRQHAEPTFFALFTHCEPQRARQACRGQNQATAVAASQFIGVRNRCVVVFGKCAWVNGWFVSLFGCFAAFSKHGKLTPIAEERAKCVCCLCLRLYL